MDDHDQYWIAQHVFAHDNEFAYDSLGKHPLPYEVSGASHTQLDMTRQQAIDDGWGLYPDITEDAKRHIHENGILK